MRLKASTTSKYQRPSLGTSQNSESQLKHSSKMTSPYKQVLVVGATSGIGHAMASRLIKEGSKVVAVGRRQDRLDAFVEEHGPDKAAFVKFDIGDLKSIPGFVKE